MRRFLLTAAASIAAFPFACSSPPAAGPPAAPPRAATSAAAAPIALPGPPVAPVREARDTSFGTEIVDPYRWMETESPEYAAWMKGQADYARRALDALPERAALLARVRELDNASPNVWGVQRAGERVFSFEADPGKDNLALYVRQGLAGARRLLIDPTALPPAGTHVSLSYWEPSPDGRLVAYGLSQSGSEDATLHVLDVETGRDLPDVIDRARQALVSWLDGKRFFYRRVPKVAPGTAASERLTKVPVYLHVLGTDPEKDEPVFGYGVSPSLELPANAWAWVGATPGSAHLVAAYNDGVRQEHTIFTAPRAAFAGAKTPWKRVADVDEKVVSIDVRGDEAFLLSRRGAPRGQVLRLDLRRPDLSRAAIMVPQDATAVVDAISVAKDALYVRKLDGGVGKLFRAPWGGGPLEPVDPGAGGSVGGLSTDVTHTGALFFANAWTSSTKIVFADPARKTATDTGIIPPSKVSFDGIVAVEERAKSADGTMVPISILRRADAPRDGSSPAYLLGYASYGNVARPYFEPMRLAWLERGGTWAYCHARGGGEYGEAWHEGGKLGTKTNTIEDFLACARYLIEEKYSAPGRIGGHGQSAGGIMIGGALVRRPDLFGAAIASVGMVNALRFEQIPIGPFNTSEFGTVATREGFEMLRAIDAYHKVEQGKPYPAVLLTTGITDTRVSPWQMAKMAARLQAATSSGKPVLLRVSYDAGHGIGSTRSQVEEETADIYAFLRQQLSAKP